MRLLAVLAVASVIAVSCSSSEPETAGGELSTVDEVSHAPGAQTTGRLTVEGFAVDYVAITPDGFVTGNTAPVLIAFPPGGQDFATTQSVANETYLTEAVARGWVVFSPAAPERGTLWFDQSADLVPEILDWIETWVEPENGRFHVAGISNGGLSTFALAARVPDRIESMVVFPGFPRTDSEIESFPALLDIPILMFVGGNDPTWIAPMEAAADAIAELGGEVELEVFPGECHIIGALREGVRVFDELEANRAG